MDEVMAAGGAGGGMFPPPQGHAHVVRHHGPHPHTHHHPPPHHLNMYATLRPGQHSRAIGTTVGIGGDTSAIPDFMPPPPPMFETGPAVECGGGVEAVAVRPPVAPKPKVTGGKHGKSGKTPGEKKRESTV